MAPREETKFELGVAEPLVEHLETPTVRFPEPLVILAKRKAFIIKFVAVACVIAVVVVLLLKNTYTSTTRILPPQQTPSMSATATLSQLGPLAALAGSAMGMKNPGDIYVSMLKSDSVANALIDRFNLMSVYKTKLRVDTQKKLDDNSLIVLGKDGVISISVEDHDPKRAAEMAKHPVPEPPPGMTIWNGKVVDPATLVPNPIPLSVINPMPAVPVGKIQ